MKTETDTRGATTRPLDDEERETAERWWPDAVRLAQKMVGRYARGCDPHDVAVNGLMKAIRTNAGRAVPRPFLADLKASMFAAAIDEFRQQTHRRRRYYAPQVPFSVLFGEEAEFFESVIPAGGPPVGRELESRDEVVALSRKVRHGAGEAIRLLYLDPGCERAVDVARRMGVSQSRVSQMLSAGYADIAQALGDAS